ncbi:Lrp/AsnC family transcriptional regulator [Vibrio brasiliensis]
MQHTPDSALPISSMLLDLPFTFAINLEASGYRGQLENDGIISGYSANLSPNALGLNICVLISVKLNRHAPDSHEQFIREIESQPEVSEYILVAGNYDYLLRVWVEDTAALTSFVANVLQGIPSVSETSTMLV